MLSGCFNLSGMTQRSACRASGCSWLSMAGVRLVTTSRIGQAGETGRRTRREQIARTRVFIEDADEYSDN